jgi:hypothetical protein
MHELGHNLGLRHGGQDDIQNKPNYLSIMSYSFQMRGLVVSDSDLRFDYARFAGPTLDERNLNEKPGLPGIDDKYGTRKFICNWTEKAKFEPVKNPEDGIDWNCTGGKEESGVSYDINADQLCVGPGANGERDTTAQDDDTVSGAYILTGSDHQCDTVAAGDDEQLSTLHSYDDWSRIVFDGGLIAFGQADEELPLETVIDEMTPEDAEAILPETFYNQLPFVAK